MYVCNNLGYKDVPFYISILLAYVVSITMVYEFCLCYKYRLSIQIVGCCCKGDLYVQRSRTLGAINANKWTTIKQIHIFGNP